MKFSKKLLFGLLLSLQIIVCQVSARNHNQADDLKVKLIALDLETKTYLGPTQNSTPMNLNAIEQTEYSDFVSKKTINIEEYYAKIDELFKVKGRKLPIELIIENRFKLKNEEAMLSIKKEKREIIFQARVEDYIPSEYNDGISYSLMPSQESCSFRYLNSKEKTLSNDKDDKQDSNYLLLSRDSVNILKIIDCNHENQEIIDLKMRLLNQNAMQIIASKTGLDKDTNKMSTITSMNAQCKFVDAAYIFLGLKVPNTKYNWLKCMLPDDQGQIIFEIAK